MTLHVQTFTKQFNSEFRILLLDFKKIFLIKILLHVSAFHLSVNYVLLG